jgi:hypothetical protein
METKTRLMLWSATCLIIYASAFGTGYLVGRRHGVESQAEFVTFYNEARAVLHECAARLRAAPEKFRNEKLDKGDI